MSIRAVAEAVGVTSPSVYRHFPSKQHLVREVLRLRFQEFREALLEAARRSHQPGGRLLEACRAYVSFGLANPGHYRLLFSTAGMGPMAAGLRAGEAHPGETSLAVLFELVAERLGEGPEMVPRALELWSSLHGIVDLRITKPEMDWPPEDALVRLALRVIDETAEGRTADGSIAEARLSTASSRQPRSPR